MGLTIQLGGWYPHIEIKIYKFKIRMYRIKIKNTDSKSFEDTINQMTIQLTVQLKIKLYRIKIIIYKIKIISRPNIKIQIKVYIMKIKFNIIKIKIHRIIFWK